MCCTQVFQSRQSLAHAYAYHSVMCVCFTMSKSVATIYTAQTLITHAKQTNDLYWLDSELELIGQTVGTCSVKLLFACTMCMFLFFPFSRDWVTHVQDNSTRKSTNVSFVASANDSFLSRPVKSYFCADKWMSGFNRFVGAKLAILFFSVWTLSLYPTCL
jgi:hypothetical protein